MTPNTIPILRVKKRPQRQGGRGSTLPRRNLIFRRTSARDWTAELYLEGRAFHQRRLYPCISKPNSSKEGSPLEQISGLCYRYFGSDNKGGWSNKVSVIVVDRGGKTPSPVHFTRFCFSDESGSLTAADPKGKLDKEGKGFRKGLSVCSVDEKSTENLLQFKWICFNSF
ncbi:hypothetical protein TNIN_417051 [Trichonephila inaurata madagascariensis]|uniref:Uncharacterized protein n=1 Tax=Trichonephila inaurata madagascariensis TaxID=2747483 RepID=A0A8X6Y1K7_9ARAC|nr:hypothetical protein TNIN_417051 [Trichonephila inaurata madagascariensis]